MSGSSAKRTVWEVVETLVIIVQTLGFAAGCVLVGAVLSGGLDMLAKVTN